jgi:hypothetical protein
MPPPTALASLILLLAAFFPPACSAPAPSFCDAQPGWRLDWQDEFDGLSLNTSSWTALDADTWDIGCCRDAACLADNVRVSGGALHMLSDRQAVKGHNFTTGAVRTKGKRSWTATASSSFRVCVSAVLPGELHGRLTRDKAACDNCVHLISPCGVNFSLPPAAKAPPRAYGPRTG